MNEAIVNKVTGSGLISIDLEDFYPKEEVVAFDLKPYLFMDLILKEKDFREKLKATDFTPFQNKNVAVFCSADAIIPVWAYMLVATYLQPIAKDVYTGTVDEMHKYLFLTNIEQINASDYADARVVVKGCGDVAIGEFAYAAITKLLLPVVKSIMYGEPCSTVPVYKKK